MPFKRLFTAKVAKLAGCHPNTVRRYEEWGFISPAARTESGYRLFTDLHVDQMRLARIVLGAPWVGREIRRLGVLLVRQAAAVELRAALDNARLHLDLVRQEREQAETAAELLHRWAEHRFVPREPGPALHTTQAARLLHSTYDTIRNWERNGLIHVPRDPNNGYRQFTSAEIERLRVIRMLVQSGYSLMAVLRALSFLDRGQEGDVVLVLDTPMPGEEIMTTADHWLSSLDEQERRGRQMVALLEEMVAKYVP